jgi:uncharacterized protein with beta-barrel porin domain
VAGTGSAAEASLRSAIDGFNAQSSGSHTIQFDNGMNVSLLSNLQMITGAGKSLTIDMNSSTINGGGASAIFFVESGNVVIENGSLTGGRALGGAGGAASNFGSGGGGGLGAGGALFVNDSANVTLRNAQLTGNSAIGGAGGNDGSLGASGYSAGGGGGFRGNGGAGGDTGGGGGGGFQGNAGNGSYDAGGGGGGAYGNGADASGLFGGGGGGETADAFDDAGGGIEGGSGGLASPGQNANASGGGGGGGSLSGEGGNGAAYGGGGGSGYSNIVGGGSGGDFGGGGGGGYSAPGGNGGFGAGGGGAGFVSTTSGTGGFGGGNGGNYGTITTAGNGGSGFGGAVFVREGGTLTLENVNFSSNTVQAGTGGSSLSINGADGDAAGGSLYLMQNVNLVLGGSTNFTIADEIAGAGGLVKQGDSVLTITGAQTYTGTTSVDQGKLVVNGSLASDVTIADGAILGGNNTIQSLILNGTIAPGNSIGSTIVSGNATINSSSVTEVEIRPASNPTTPGVDNDHIQVNGTATINGGTVNVKGAVGTYNDGARYTFLSATNVSGHYDSIIDDLAFFDAALGYTGTTAYIDLIANQSSFASQAATGNQYVVGQYLDRNTSGASGEFQMLLDELKPMTQGQVQSILSQSSGSIYGSQSQLNVTGTGMVVNLLGQQMRTSLTQSMGGSGGIASLGSSFGSASNSSNSPVMLVSYQKPLSSCDVYRVPTRSRCNPWTGRIIGYGLGGNASNDGNADATSYGVWGSLAQIERAIDEGTRVGLFGGYGGSQVTTGGGVNQRVRTNGGYFGGLGSRTNGTLYGLGFAGLQFDGYDSQRTIVAGAVNQTATGSTSGWQGFTYGELGLTLDLTDRVVLQPFNGMQYVYVRRNSFTEIDAGPLNLAVSGDDTDSLRNLLGSRIQLRGCSLGRWCIAPDATAAWIHEYLDTDSLVQARFAGIDAGGYSVNGLNLGRDWALVGTGFGARLSNSWQLRGDYYTQFNSNQVMHMGTGSVAYTW